MALDKHLNDPKHRQYLKKRKVNSNPVNTNNRTKEIKKIYTSIRSIIFHMDSGIYYTSIEKITSTILY